MTRFNPFSALVVASLIVFTANCSDKADDDVDLRFNTGELSVMVTVSPRDGAAPVAVRFFSTVIGAHGEVEYAWSFGDGATSSEASPSHTYEEAGFYSVSLRVTDANRNTAANGTALVVQEPPRVTLTATPDFGSAPLAVSFTCSNDTWQGQVTYHWEFGDGNTSTQQNPAHTYIIPGNFTASCLTQVGDAQASASVSLTVRENTVPQVTIAADPREGELPLSVDFSSVVIGGDGELSYSWDFGDGSEVVTAESPSHSFDEVGVYLVVLTVIDEDGDAGADVREITVRAVPNSVPTVAVSARPMIGIAPLRVQFSSLVTGGDGDLTYAWDFDDGSAGSVESNPEHTFAESGSYLVRLVVEDEDGDSASDTVEVIVSSDEVPSLMAWGNPLVGVAPLRVQFQADAAGGNPPLRFSWDFDDGSPAKTNQNPLHTYAEAGSYTVRATVSDLDGDSDEVQIAVTVFPAPELEPPSVVLTATPNLGKAPLAVSFTCQNETWEGSLSYRWEFGDGRTSTQQNPSITYTNPGTYSASCVTLLGDAQAGGSIAVTVRENSLPLVSIGANPLVGLVPLAVDFTSVVRGGDGELAYAWDFGDGGAFSNQPAPTHLFDEPGVYLVVLTVTDEDGDIGSDVREITVNARLNSIPTVSASAQPAQGVAPLLVQFNSVVVGGDGELTYRWDFDDGSTGSSEANPEHTFDEAGTYLVALEVEDEDGDKAAHILQVNVASNEVPSLMAWGTPLRGVAPLQVQFTAEAAGGNAPLRFGWDFGDESPTSIIQNPSHTYSEPGLYQVVVSVTDLDGDADQVELQVEALEPDVPMVLSTSVTPDAGPAPLQVVFACSVEGGNPPIIYTWEFGDGQRAYTANANHTYTSQGVFSATCTATDLGGTEAKEQVNITVTPANLPPVAIAENLSDDCVVPRLSIVELDASESYDPNHDALSYEWAFRRVPTGSRATFNNSTIVNPSFQPDVTGVYEVMVYVSDGVHRTGSNVLFITASSEAGAIAVLTETPLLGSVGEPILSPLRVQVENTCGVSLPFATLFWTSDKVQLDTHQTQTDYDGVSVNWGDFGYQAGEGEIVVRSGSAEASFEVTVEGGAPAYLLMNIVEPSSVDATATINLQLTDFALNPLAGPDVEFELWLSEGGDMHKGGWDYPHFVDTGNQGLLGTTTAGEFSAVVGYQQAWPIFVNIDVFPLDDDTYVEGRGLHLLLSDDLSKNIDNWYFQPRGQWEIGSPSSGPGEAPTGDSLLATRLASNYEMTSHSWVTYYPEPEHYFYGYYYSTTLEIDHWYDFGGKETCTAGTGLISFDDSTFVSPLEGYPGPALCSGDEYWGFGGQSDGWQTSRFSLFESGGGGGVLQPFDVTWPGDINPVEPEAGLSFHLFAPSYPASSPGAGWYIDNIRIVGLADVGLIPFVPGEPSHVDMYVLKSGTSADFDGQICQTPALIKVYVVDQHWNKISDEGIEIEFTLPDGARVSDVLHGELLSVEDGVTTIATGEGGNTVTALSSDTQGFMTVSAAYFGTPIGEFTVEFLEPIEGECCVNAIPMHVINGYADSYIPNLCSYAPNDELPVCGHPSWRDVAFAITVDESKEYVVYYSSWIDGFTAELRALPLDGSCPGEPLESAEWGICFDRTWRGYLDSDTQYVVVIQSRYADYCPYLYLEVWEAEPMIH